MGKRKNVDKRTDTAHITGRDLHLGHVIITRNERGVITKTTPVRTITRGECGQGMHVNGSECYDKCMHLEVFC
jgi:hypothetical protein